MELLDVTLTGLQRRNRAAFVRRSENPGAPELYSGQKVVLRDEDGEFFAGTVVDLHDEVSQSYLVHLGVRLPEEFAMMRLGRMQGGAGGEDQVQEVLDLLGDAREVLARMPGQRQAD